MKKCFNFFSDIPSEASIQNKQRSWISTKMFLYIYKKIH